MADSLKNKRVLSGGGGYWILFSNLLLKFKLDKVEGTLLTGGSKMSESLNSTRVLSEFYFCSS
jgi:hypothetical protein